MLDVAANGPVESTGRSIRWDPYEVREPTGRSIHRDPSYRLAPALRQRQ